MKEFFLEESSRPLCPPTSFAGFLLLLAAEVAMLVVGCVYLSVANGPVQFCFVGVLLLGTSIALLASTAAAVELTPLELNYRYVLGCSMYIVLSVVYTVFGAKTKDPGSLGCGIVLILLIPALFSVHILRPPGLVVDNAGLLDAPYRDLKTEHGPPSGADSSTYV